jgi:hypothetical protein
MKKEYLIYIGLSVAIIWLLITLRSQNVAYNESNKFNKELIQQIKTDLLNQTKSEQEKIKKYNVQIDSLQVLFNYSEELRKKNFKYYENESLKLKNVNTFDKRNKYLDSLNNFLLK